LEGELERERLEEAFRNLIGRHESLRTFFPLISHEPVQRVHDDIAFSVDYSEAKINIEDSECGGQVQAIITNFVRPFDLSRAPLLRVELVEFREAKHLMMADIHHIAADGLSNQIVVKDFMDLYAAKELPPLRIQYKDFSEWQNHEKRKEEWKNREEFWLEQFEDKIPVLNLPTDYSRPPVKTFEGERIHFGLEANETRALKELALQEETTLYTVLLAVYYILLYKISGQEDIIVGTPVAGRIHADLQPIIGMFLNTLAIRNTVDGALSFKDFLQQVKKRVLDSFENQEYQFEELVEKVALNRDMSRNPIFDVLFSLENFRDPEMKNTRLHLKSFEYKGITSKFDLHFRAMEAEETLFFGVEYSTSLFKRDTINRFVLYFKKIAIEVVSHPGKQLAAIKRLTKKRDHDLLAQFSDDLECE
jgi:fengycin family lipopeptide synthetase D